MEQRKELVDKGPFNLIFHGIEPDWIEAEMCDDEDFTRDVILQRMKTIIKEEVTPAALYIYRVAYNAKYVYGNFLEYL